ncbi:HNH endonuclease [Deinococcus aquatilis]|uniref:HNH endonuclease n=1 Tax=Deinococcus aquatilis TaxID=519440 RepID=UPI000A04425E|nr:HNH endonuclease domain-containing protein [Deinococcus aquatilis]
MTLDRNLYAVWGRTQGIEPGVYYAHWRTELRDLIEGTKAHYKRVGSHEEGLRLLETNGYAWARHYLPKAKAMHNRCWYCARQMDLKSIHQPDSAEIEHQVPQCTGWIYVDREENIVIACRKCNNDKSDRDVEAFRQYLTCHEQERVVFYGEVLRFIRANVASIPWLGHPLTQLQAEEVLSWYQRSKNVRLHHWADELNDLADYVSGLQLPIPLDDYPYALGAPERLTAKGPAPRALGSMRSSTFLEDDDY